MTGCDESRDDDDVDDADDVDGVTKVMIGMPTAVQMWICDIFRQLAAAQMMFVFELEFQDRNKHKHSKKVVFVVLLS